MSTWHLHGNETHGGVFREDECPNRIGGCSEVIVLQLGNGYLAGWEVLIDCLLDAEKATGYDMVFSSVIDQIKAQITPLKPKPDEPLGLGAVVVDRNLVEFIHLGSGLWVYGTTDGPSAGWASADLDAVEVLSEGVTP